MKILEMLTEDHATILQTIRSILAAEYASERRSLFADFVEDLERHLAFEEEVFYPQVAEVLPDMEEEIAADRIEHEGARELLAELEEDFDGNEEWTRRLEQLLGDLEAHMQDEQDNLFPAVRQEMSEGVLARMTALYQRRQMLRSAAE